jgi:hypothetical protein
MTPITLYGSIVNCGDGSASISWFLTEEEAEYDQENASEGWGETCIETVESYEGSYTHQEALRNSEEQAEERA